MDPLPQDPAAGANVGDNVPPIIPAGAPAAPAAAGGQAVPPIPPAVANLGIYNAIEGVCRLEAYDLLNGDPAAVRPYLQRSTVPEHLKWVLVGNVPSDRALSVVDAFIKSHLFHVFVHSPRDWTVERKRDVGITLGIMRCVISSNYVLDAGSFLPGETIPPLIGVTWAENLPPAYNVLTAPAPGTNAAAAAAAYLAGNLVLTPEEIDRVRGLIKCGMAVIPVQGHNLMVDGHHYISDRDKASFKAFLGVEKHLMLTGPIHTWFHSDLEFNRDIMWHKAGHPVSVAIKLAAATSPRLIESLKKADVGSAVARLPAVESDARTASAYIKLCRAVRTNFQQSGGDLDFALLEDAFEAIQRFPHGVEPPAGGVRVSEDVTVRSRTEARAHLDDVCKRNAETVAMFFGYYSMMMENTQNAGPMEAGESVTKAFSLRKLRSECMASYHMGIEMFKDYQAARAKARSAGKFVAPSLALM